MTERVITAGINLLATEAGGRGMPMASGYRSLARFEGSEADFGFELELSDLDALQPGGEGTGQLSFWAVEELPDLPVGTSFEIREGTQVVGHGRIIGAAAS
jgi:hypothetical protein